MITEKSINQQWMMVLVCVSSILAALVTYLSGWVLSSRHLGAMPNSYQSNSVSGFSLQIVICLHSCVGPRFDFTKARRSKKSDLLHVQLAFLMLIFLFLIVEKEEHGIEKSCQRHQMEEQEPPIPLWVLRMRV